MEWSTGEFRVHGFDYRTRARGLWPWPEGGCALGASPRRPLRERRALTADRYTKVRSESPELV